MSTLFVFAYISLLIAGMQLTWTGRYRGERMSYSESMKRLEEIVAALEAGGADLDETLKLFEEGSKLLKSCQEELAEAEGKVEKLRLEDVE